MKLAPLGARSGASILALVVAAGGIAGQAHAAAFYLQEQSTVAVGRAFSGEVSEQGAQQQWWNPAAIGGITGIQTYQGIPRSCRTPIRPIAGRRPRARPCSAARLFRSAATRTSTIR